MTFLSRALSAVSGDETARSWLLDHARTPEGRAVIIACDFDGTLCRSEYPVIIAPNEPLLKAVHLLQGMGYEFILWTCREGDTLMEALAWLAARGIRMKANDNSEAVIEFYNGYNSRKIFADEYWDDKAARAAFDPEEHA